MPSYRKALTWLKSAIYNLKHKEIIVYLILQELKFSQLREGLKEAGFETQVHNISLLEVIISLMTPLGNKDEYYEVLYGIAKLYNECLLEAKKYPVSIMGDELEPLAKKIYFSIQYYLRTKQ